ncbi:MAG: hypothetical protein HY532_08945 [Chloroflexi bacterium]|nr:hypothetical protein [Chloroflexota bacterium]
METARKAQHGFTARETAILIAVAIVLAAILTPALAGVLASVRAEGKETDLKNLTTGVTRYVTDNNELPIIGSAGPTKSLADADGDGVITVKVNTNTEDPDGFLPDSEVDVVCGSESSSMANALAECFSGIDFIKLTPDYTKAPPKHSNEIVTVTTNGLGAVADLVITGADSSGHTIELYLDDHITPSDGLRVWSVDNSGKVIVLKNNSDYGRG